MRWIALALFVVASSAGPALAQGAQRIGQFQDWAAFRDGNGENLRCWIVSAPREAALKNRRGDIFVMVWQAPATGQRDVVQVNIGYTFQSGSEAKITIGDRSWNLFTQDSNAWTYVGANDDAEIVAAMRRGRTMRVEGVSNRGNPTTDVYSLAGVTKANNASNEACGR